MNTPTFQIRPLETTEIARVRDLILTTIEISYAIVYPPSAVSFFKGFHDEETLNKRANDGCILVAEKNRDFIATGALVDGEILAVFVLPYFQRNGLGQAIMAKLEERARREGRTECTLSISLPSRAFYESLSYEIIEERVRPLGEGQELRFWKARKRLST